ncbi:MAG: electron transfer flavoprotein subunit beta/FixA family protein [Gammaproteobacteria bacterium]|nr:electron transfer flavoprotein subunit beta/FixA family protein [Gammaproteobacteria bacterium]
MKALVAIKRVVDAHIQVSINSDGTALELEGLKTAVNPFDENALEEALRLKESGHITEILAVTIGTQSNVEILRHALAMGADRALLLETNLYLVPLAAAKLLKALVLEESPEIVLLGKKAIDDDAGQTGQMLAGLLGYPQATSISSLSIEGKDLIVKREIEGGTERLSLRSPAVVTADLRLNEPRFIKLPNLMKARKLPIEILSVKNFNIDTTPKLKTIFFKEPPKRRPSVVVNSVKELVEKLRANEGITL